MHFMKQFAEAGLLWMFMSVTVVANSLPEDMTVTLISRDGDRLDIGSLAVQETAEGYDYDFKIDNQVFDDYFLSMRPFKCITGHKILVCNLEYPYDKTSKLSADDLTDLEYDLLFIHKTPEEYGIDAWNGLYYQLELHDQKITGTLHEVDLNVLAVPPKPGVMRPVKHTMLHPADPDVHAFPTIEIH